jgi:hypothetical protein
VVDAPMNMNVRLSRVYVHVRRVDVNANVRRRLYDDPAPFVQHMPTARPMPMAAQNDVLVAGPIVMARVPADMTVIHVHRVMSRIVIVVVVDRQTALAPRQ